MPRCLDLGCGESLRGAADWDRWGVEQKPSTIPQVVQADLVFDPLPFPDNHFDRVFAYDILEHLEKRVYVPVIADGRLVRMQSRNAIIELFNEVYRVLVPGGIFESSTPHLPAVADVYRDPEHVSVWVEESWGYLVATGPQIDLGRHYGLTAVFHPAQARWNGAHLQVALIAVKE